MTVSKTWNNTVYSIPQSGDRGWSTLTNFLTGLADNAQTTNKQIFGSRVATTSPVTVTAVSDCYVGINVPGAIAAVALPAGVTGQVLFIGDESNAAATYNITITPNGANTIDGAATYVISGNKQIIGMTFRGGDWKIFANFSSTSLTASSTTTLTNKSLQDSTTWFVDNLDATKKLQFQCSGITTATTRTATVPDADFTMVGTATTQTLTNKTLSGNTAVNLISGSGTLTLNTSGTATIPNATDTLVGKATTDTLTNKSIDADTNTITNIENADIKAAAGIVITKIAPGTADQLIGANTGATANEYKSLAVGTAGTNFAIAHTANTITFNIPDASAANRGLVTTGAQTLAGAKTLSGVTTLGASGSFSGNLIYGVTDATAKTAGTVGEYLISSATSLNLTTSLVQVASLAITKGDWDLVGVFSYSGGASPTNIILGISTTTASLAGTVFGISKVIGAVNTTSGSGCSVIPRFRINISADTTYYLNVSCSGGSDASAASACSLTARRR